MPSYLLVPMATTADPHHLPSALLLYSPRVTGWLAPVLEVYGVLSMLIASQEMPVEDEAPNRAEFLAVRQAGQLSFTDRSEG
jgi:hypothetical protein